MLDFIPRKLAVLVSAAMIVTGFVLGLWALSNFIPPRGSVLAEVDGAVDDEVDGEPVPSQLPHSLATGITAPSTVAPGLAITGDGQTLTATAEVSIPVAAAAPARALEIAVHPGVPAMVRDALEVAPPPGFDVRLAAAEAALPDLRMDLDASDSALVYEQFYAAAARFDTVHPTLSWLALRTLWQSDGDVGAAEAPAEGSRGGSLEASLRAAGSDEEEAAAAEFTAVAVLTDTLAALESILGPSGGAVQGYESRDQIAAAVYSGDGEAATVALLPFELLQPSLLVLAIDGQNPVENAHKFDADAYPLTVPIYTHVVDAARSERTGIDVNAVLPQLPITNRDPGKITVLAMTGVTAMVRNTAAQMDELGDAWPAEVIGSELALADITHVSNEVPFVPDCETDTSADNLVFCSKPGYMRTLEAIGTDIIGLTGNHQNDYGRDGALASLALYEEAGLPVYGGGINKEAAFAPLYMEHNGNRLAFLGANSFGPTFAWAGDEWPGSAEFDLAIMSATVRNIKAKGLADLVLVELQYQESYETEPLLDQRIDFTALIAAGADIVTGVQSHVPQGLEFDDGHLVLYGLGNLFFDQMWAQETREGLIPKHTFYEGQHISTQLLTTVLYDSGQPHWATPEEREQILRRVFDASYLE